MFHSLYNRKVDFSVIPIDSSYMKLSSKQVDSKGVISRVSVFEKSDNSESMSKYTFDDFSLQNILAIGAYDMLKPVYAPDVNPLNVVDHVDSTLKSIKSMYDSIKSETK